jgi:hypothetical protein
LPRQEALDLFELFGCQLHGAEFLTSGVRLQLALTRPSCRSPMIADDPHWSAIYDKKSTFN